MGAGFGPGFGFGLGVSGDGAGPGLGGVIGGVGAGPGVGVGSGDGVATGGVEALGEPSLQLVTWSPTRTAAAKNAIEEYGRRKDMTTSSSSDKMPEPHWLSLHAACRPAR